MSRRSGFTSRLGVILATAGSAVGLGNIWRFPYEAGEHGGGIFIVVYLLCILVMGLPAMLCELMLGRRAQRNATRAYGRSAWRWVGYVGVLTGFIIMGFYAVVAGWTLQYAYASVVGTLRGDAAYAAEYFNAFINHPVKPVVWALLTLLLTHVIIASGVQKGIERMSKLLMPLLLVLLVVLVACVAVLPGAMAGVEFLLKPDVSKFSGETLFSALGQTFFSLSIGMGCLLTYGSYFNRRVPLVRSAVQIVCIDTLVALLAGLLIFPAAFAAGVKPDAGPALIFITLPTVFHQVFGDLPALAAIVSLMFYILLFVAALTSLLSLHEPPTAFVHEEWRLSRRNASRLVTVGAILLCVACSLSLGACPQLHIGERNLFDFLDYLTAQYLLVGGGLLTSIYVGWVWPRRRSMEQLTTYGLHASKLVPFLLFAIRWLCPIGILFGILHQFSLI